MAHSIQNFDGRAEIFNDFDLVALLALMFERVQQHPERFRAASTMSVLVALKRFKALLLQHDRCE